MRIEIVDKGKRRSIRIPTGMLVNPLTAAAAGKAIGKSLGAELSLAQRVALSRAIHRARDELRSRNEPLAEVLSADGEAVRIEL